MKFGIMVLCDAVGMTCLVLSARKDRIKPNALTNSGFQSYKREEKSTTSESIKAARLLQPEAPAKGFSACFGDLGLLSLKSSPCSSPASIE
jgi:hypothetical protein